MKSTFSRMHCEDVQVRRRYLSAQEHNVRIKRIDVLYGYSRLPDGFKVLSQESAEHNEGDCLGLERPANAANLFHEFHISFWQSELAQCLFWQLRGLFNRDKPRRTRRARTKSSYFSLALWGIFGCVLLSLKTSIRLGKSGLKCIQKL